MVLVTVVTLTQSGEVYTFGSNSYGQLGVGDIMIRGGPVQVKLPGPAVHIASGSNHSVVLTAKGEVYTFGSHQVCPMNIMSKNIHNIKLFQHLL